MTLLGVLLVTAVVWAVSVIRSTAWRAFVYSLPLPMTVALMATGVPVDGAQVLGVGALNLFFVTVAVTHDRLRWHIATADAGGIGAYLAVSWLILRAGPVPFWPAVAAMAGLWAIAMLVSPRNPAPGGAAPVHVPPGIAAPGPPGSDRPARRSGLPLPAKPFVILVGALLTMLLGQALRGMVVTFPYAGVLTAVEARHDLPAFTRHLARNSLALVGFLAGYQSLQHRSPLVAVAAGWLAFGALAVTQLAADRLRGGAGMVRRESVGTS
ncbi:hypothetical protein [Plantactinospora sp. GCM10030261]|uniref:hypothetical protein n=1 Tax=Plantactinospora sp. GCM10030261 TaxID=3273420 RepID=UPI00360A83C6